MNFAVTKMSSKGQIVIPQKLRNKFKVGDSILIIEQDGNLILKNKEKLYEQTKQDREFVRETEAAYKRIEKGKSTTMEFDDFIEEMKKW